MAAIVMAGTSVLAGCGAYRSQVICDMSPPPRSPIEVPRSWSFGAVIVVGVVGEDLGRTTAFDPGYRTDRHAFGLERVVAVVPGSPSEQLGGTAVADAARSITEIGNVRYPDQSSSCGGKAENASFDEGDRVLVMLGVPGPTAGLWTVGPAVTALDISGEPGAQTATWQHRTTQAFGGCDGHLTYDLAALEAGFASIGEPPAAGPGLEPTCTQG